MPKNALNLLMKSLLYIFASCFVLVTSSALAADLEVPLNSIAQIYVDDDGLPLSYPSSVFFDSAMGELYLVNGGSARVVVYGPDFFPRVSMGIGRGVAAPRGGIVNKNGEVYICQSRNVKNPRSRITILNGAFLVDREIFIDEIPQAHDFLPRQLAIDNTGIIYLVGDGARGVMVLDEEGNFLRWLKPMDQVSLSQLDETDIQSQELIQQDDKPLSEEAEEAGPAEGINWADVPEEFRPRNVASNSTDRVGKGLGPVKVNHVSIDSKGNIYLISLETSKIYVYSPDERLLFSFGEKGGTPRHLSQPKSLAIDEKLGVIYVADYMRHTILAYDMSGKYMFEFGGRGYGPGWFNFPSGIAVNDQGQIVVADLFNKRVQVLEIIYEELIPFLHGDLEESSPILPPQEESEGIETEQDRLTPGQPDFIIEEEVIPEQYLPGKLDDARASEDELQTPAPYTDTVIDEVVIPEGNLSEKPDAVKGRENEMQTPLAYPEPEIEEVIIKEEQPYEPPTIKSDPGN
jgi:DNA-binding beta-propeller fold protein YncE